MVDDFRVSVVFVRLVKVVVEKYWVGLDWWIRIEEDFLLFRFGVEEWCIFFVIGVYEEIELEGEILGVLMYLGFMRNKIKISVFIIMIIIMKEGKEGIIIYFF